MSLTETHAYVPELFYAEDFPVVTEIRTLKAGQNQVRGAVLGTVTADDKLILSDEAAVDGSEVPEVVLAADADATAGDVLVPVYVSGSLNGAALTYGGNHTATTVAKALRGSPLFVRTLD